MIGAFVLIWVILLSNSSLHCRFGVRVAGERFGDYEHFLRHACPPWEGCFCCWSDWFQTCLCLGCLSLSFQTLWLLLARKSATAATGTGSSSICCYSVGKPHDQFNNKSFLLIDQSYYLNKLVSRAQVLIISPLFHILLISTPCKKIWKIPHHCIV